MNRKLFIIPLALLLLTACEEETGLSVSRVTNFADLVMEGEPLVFLTTGDDYQDPGVTAFEGDQEIEVEVEGDFNTQEPGYYPIRYTAVNSDGFPNTVVREIIVVDADAAATDLSGQYRGSGFGTQMEIATVTKLGPGYYSIDEVLGSRNRIPGRFIHLGGNEIIAPPTATNFGEVAIGPDYPGTFGELTDTGFRWVVYIGCCGNFGPITYLML